MPELPAHGCRIDAEPQDCVLDAGEHHLCLYAAEITRRHECPWWQEEEASPAELAAGSLGDAAPLDRRCNAFRSPDSTPPR